MGEDYYKAKYKTVKKELRKVRTEMEELRQSLQVKLDHAERERDELAEKIDQDFPRPQSQAVYDFFDQTLPLSAAELRDCSRNTASDTARQIAKKVFGSDTMREAGCVTKLDENLVREISKYTMAKFKLRLKSEEKAIRKGIIDACQYERTKVKQPATKQVELTSNTAQTEQSNDQENRAIEPEQGTSIMTIISEVNLNMLTSN